MDAAMRYEPGIAIDDQTTSGERAYATCNHLVMLAGIPVLPQLIMWLIKRDESPFLDDHGKEALNFQISVILLAAISGVLIVVGIGVLMLLALGPFILISTIVAAVRASQGRYFRYPMTIRLIP
jgi:uncharacterized protein